MLSLSLSLSQHGLSVKMSCKYLRTDLGTISQPETPRGSKLPFLALNAIHFLVRLDTFPQVRAWATPENTHTYLFFFFFYQYSHSISSGVGALCRIYLKTNIRLKNYLALDKAWLYTENLFPLQNGKLSEWHLLLFNWTCSQCFIGQTWNKPNIPGYSNLQG